MYIHILCLFIFFFNDTATTEIYTLSLHDALPISPRRSENETSRNTPSRVSPRTSSTGSPISAGSLGNSSPRDRKSTRLNSSHANISYAVFCLKKKKKTQQPLSRLMSLITIQPSYL